MRSFLSKPPFLQGFFFGAAQSVALLATCLSPALADTPSPPPIGYVGPVSSTSTAPSPPSPSSPPIGYVGPVLSSAPPIPTRPSPAVIIPLSLLSPVSEQPPAPASLNASSFSTTTSPPIGYLGPVPTEQLPIQKAPTKTVALTPSVPSEPVEPQSHLALQSPSGSSAASSPPIGYVGPVPTGETESPVMQSLTLPSPPPEPVSTVTVSSTSTPSPSAPPLGYVRPVPSLSTAPPIGYVGIAPAPILPSTTYATTSMVSPTSSRTTKQVPPQNASAETLITAQEMHADQDKGLYIATGRVEVARGGYILHADKVTYNQKTGVMRAEGHVAMLTPSGEVQFSDAEEITGDMKQAFAENVGILFSDSSRMIGRNSQRYDGRYMTVDNGLYTACNVCKEDPNNPPLWQLRAKEMVHDNVEHDIYYHDATLDFAGLPVFWTPYISTADPTVERRQGFLPVEPGETPNLGGYLRVPYYFDIAPETDAILAPTFSQTDKLQLAGEYRHRFEDGGMQFNGSFTHADLISDAGIDEGQQWRGHVFGNFVYDIDNVWRAGTDIQVASDKSYLERYNISSIQELTNRAYVEGFQGRDYAGINGYYFEDLRPGTQPVQPLVLPAANFSALGEPGQTFGGRWSLDGETLITQRDNANQNIDQQGPDTRKLSLDSGWERQMISDTGLVSTVSGLARVDNFWADNVIDPNGSGNSYDNVLVSRPFAQANATFRYPIGRNGDGYQQLFEPIAAFTAAPDVKNDPRTPIEESLDVAFDETNLFSPNRFTGSDLIEGGNRITYGLRHTVTTDSDAHVDMFGGQSYDFSRNDDFPGLSGLRDQVSDYVGRIDFIPTQWLNLNYGARLDHRTYSTQDQDATLSVGAPIFRPYIRYISAYQTETTGVEDNVKEGILGFDSHFSKYWSVHVDHTQGFSPDPGPRSSDIQLNYIDECFIFGVSAIQNNTNRADITSGTSVVFHFYLKNVGGVHTDSFTNAQFQPQFRQTE